jgi:hypothetical protein
MQPAETRRDDSSIATLQFPRSTGAAFLKHNKPHGFFRSYGESPAPHVAADIKINGKVICLHSLLQVSEEIEHQSLTGSGPHLLDGDERFLASCETHRAACYRHTIRPSEFPIPPMVDLLKDNEFHTASWIEKVSKL